MSDRNKTRPQLIKELKAMREKVAELESAMSHSKPSDAAKETLSKAVFYTERDIGDLKLAEIIDIQSIQSLMEHFYDLTHIPMSIIDLKGDVLLGVGWQEICSKFHRLHPETCKYCIESDIKLSSGIPEGESRLYKCKNNMWDVATPIMVGGRHVGNVFSGQFFFDDERLDYEFFRLQAKKYGFPEKEYLSALEAVTRLSKESLNAGMAFFIKLAQMISQLSYSNIQLNRSLAERDDLMNSLQATEQNFRAIFENASVGIFRTTPYGRFLNANPALARIYGYDSTKELMECVTDVGTQLYVDPEAREQCISIINKRDFAVFEARMRKKDGSICWVQQRARAVRNGEGETIYYEGFSEDVTDRKRAEEELKQHQDNLETLVRERTAQLEEKNRLLMSEIAERKKAEEALRESENTYRTIFENTGNATLFYGGDSKISLVNTEFEKLFKYTKAEVEGKKNWKDLTLEDDYERLKQYHYQREIDPEAVPKKYELRVVDRYGHIRNVYMTIALIPGTKKRVASILDITPLKEVENALRESEMHYRLLFNHAGVAIAHVDALGRLLRFNDTLADFSGYTRQELAGMLISSITHPDYLEQTEHLKNRQINGEIDQFTIEKCYVRKDGSFRWGELKATPVRDEQGKFLSAVLVINDITERKQAEKALEESEALYRNLFENAAIGMFQSSLEGRFLRINRAYATMLGFESPEEVISSITDTATQIHADPGNRETLLAALKQQDWFYGEQPYLRKDGSIMIGKISIRRVLKPDGTVSYLEGIVEDITETEAGRRGFIGKRKGVADQGKKSCGNEHNS
jgi:PAS domain S-box-containing protein